MTLSASVPRGSRWVRHFLGFAITLSCLAVFFFKVNLEELWVALTFFKWPDLVYGLLCLAVGYSLRIWRWSLMLKAAGARISYRDCVAPFLGAIALNNVLPLRAGDVIRALVFPQSMGIAKSTATSSLIIERLMDLMTLLACFSAGLHAIQNVQLPAQLTTQADTLSLIGITMLVLGFIFSGRLGRFLIRLGGQKNRSSSRLAKWINILGRLLTGFDLMSRPRILVVMLIISMLIWTGEAGLFFFVLRGTGLDASPVMALLVMGIATLSTLAPSSPGYVGPFHLAAFTAVTLAGGTEAQAGSYAVIVHMALWSGTTLAGAIALWAQPELFRRSSAAGIKV